MPFFSEKGVSAIVAPPALQDAFGLLLKRKRAGAACSVDGVGALWRAVIYGRIFHH